MIPIKMNFLMIFFLILLFVKKLQGKSEQFYACLNHDITVKSSSDCININIPDSEGYKCCSMKISFNNESSYNCFPLEKQYTTSQDTFEEYISKKSLAPLFRSIGGQMEVECGNDMKITENYEKNSDEFSKCYKSHMKGTQNENDCINNEIPDQEGSKCCFVETSTINNNGNIIDDKRCYMIQNEYFTKDKNLSNYLLDESDYKSLDEIINTNITINCKNYDTFSFNGKVKYIEPNSHSTDTIIIGNNTNSTYIPKIKEKSGLKTWVIIIIIFACILLIGIIIIIIFIYYRKRKAASESNNKNEITKGDSLKDINNKTNNNTVN